MFSKKKTKNPESLDHAHDYCLFLLNLRLRTEGEIMNKMKERGFNSNVIEEEVSALKKSDYINDSRFAEIFTDNLSKYKTYGFYMVKKKLMEKRLPNSVIEKALREFFTPKVELSVGKKYLQKQNLAEKPSFTEKQKLASRLKNRGFRTEIITKLLGN